MGVATRAHCLNPGDPVGIRLGRSQLQLVRADPMPPAAGQAAHRNMVNVGGNGHYGSRRGPPTTPDVDRDGLADG